MAGSSSATPTEEIGKVCLTRRKENTSKVISSMSRALEAAEAARDGEKASAFRA